MSQGIEEYAEIIEQLKPLVNEPDFNQQLSQIASSLPKPKRFLLKMELKRQAKPCNRSIDLRGSIDGECQAYEFDGITHYLDDIAIEVFERQIRTFGKYTQGVYEAAHNTENSFRVIQQKEQSERLKKSKSTEEQKTEVETTKPKQTFKAPVIHFSGFNQRSEERMNFSISIEVFSDVSGSLPATTIDLSVSGLKIKTHKKYLLQPGEKLSIQFRGLEGEYTLNRKEGIPYQVTDIDQSKEEQRISLKRLLEKKTPTFDEFLERFIHGNKRRYKVNLDNTIEAILAKGYEQYYIPYFTSSPVYIEKIGDSYRPRYVLTNDNNKEPLFFWADEENQLKLGYIFTDQRIKHCLTLAEGERECYLYAFNHVNRGKTYFYSATNHELAEKPELASVFYGYGARKASWRVYKLQVTEMQPSQCHMPLSLPDSLGDQIRRQNQPPAPRLMARLKNLTHIALLTDITSEWNTTPYQARKVIKEQLPKLKVFAHARNTKAAPLSLYRFKYQNLRIETRFQLRTKILISDGEVEIQGVTEDISVTGMKVELESFYHGAKNSFVTVALPDLQSMTKKHSLQELPYKVVNISKDRNVINLKAVEEEDRIAQTFFEELIKNNKGKLKYQRDEEEVPGIGEALRNIYSANLLNFAFYLKKDGIYILPDAIAKPKYNSGLMPLLSHGAQYGELNLSPLYAPKGKYRNFIQNTVKEMKTSSKPVMKELFIRFNPQSANKKESVNSFFADEFENDKQRRDFIVQAMGDGRFYCVKLVLARTGRPDTEMLHSELSYIGVYAVHRAKALEEKLWGVNCMGDLVDITAEALLRYGFNQNHIKTNQQKFI